MNKKEAQFTKVVGVRLTAEEEETLNKLCQLFNTTKSEFLRTKITAITNIIKNKEVMKKTNSDSNFKKQMNQEFNSELLNKYTGTTNSEGETPYSTPKGILAQMKNIAKNQTD